MPYKDPEVRRATNRLYQRRHYDANREAHIQNVLRWRAANPEAKRAADCSRRARKMEAFVEHVDPKVLIDLHRGVCGICGEQVGQDYHIDHIKPLARGGEHSYANTQPAHPRCNMRKGARE